MTINRAPRVVVVYRPTEWDHLIAQHATPGQVRFYLEARGADIDAVIEHDRRQTEALTTIAAAIPDTWRRARVTRADFPGFLFEPDDIIVAVGQDGLVPNVAKYLDRQPVIGVNPELADAGGVLTRFPVPAIGDLLADVSTKRATIELRTMVAAELDDGQRLVALNEIFVGHASHQSAWYALETSEGREHQASSGLIVATGTGSTGWARSIATERHSALALPHPTDERLVYFVREAFPAATTGVSLTEGIIDMAHSVVITSEMETGGRIFGDGIESDALSFSWGQHLTVRTASERLALVV